LVALRAVAFACGAEARGRDRVLQLKHRLPRRDEGSSVREGYPEVDWIRLHVDACMCAIIKGYSKCFREGQFQSRFSFNQDLSFFDRTVQPPACVARRDGGGVIGILAEHLRPVSIDDDDWHIEVQLQMLRNSVVQR